MWADLQAAYGALSTPLRDLADGLQAVHRISPLAYWGEPFDTGLSRTDADELLAAAATVPAVVHPVVRVHPVTGRRSLFVVRCSSTVGSPRTWSGCHESKACDPRPALRATQSAATARPDGFTRHTTDDPLVAIR